MLKNIALIAVIFASLIFVAVVCTTDFEPEVKVFRVRCANCGGEQVFTYTPQGWVGPNWIYCDECWTKEAEKWKEK